MKSLIDDVKRNTPKHIPGYYYLKTQKIYIPFMRITLECLTRRISDLNLFFESILKLIEISVKDLNEIASILGVSYSIVKEAVVDMVSIDYIYTSENTLGITEKGVNALKSRKRSDIQKTYLKDVMVDTITGEVYNADTIDVEKTTHKRDVLLESVVRIDSSYLDSHFKEINDVYQLQLKDNSVFGDIAITSELYKIIGVSHSELCYVENKMYIYMSETSNELLFVLYSDNNDRYKNEFYNQLKDSCRPCQEYFFENSRDFIRKIAGKPITIETDLMQQTEVVRKLLFTDNMEEDNKIDEFTKKRYALNDHEYMSYLYYFNSFRYNRIFICSDRMNSLLSDSFCSQLNALAVNISVFIIYHKDEYNVVQSLHYFFKNPATNLFLVPSDTIIENVICFDSELIIYLQENVVSAFERSVSYMLPICDFDKNRAKNLADELIEKYNLDGYVAELSTQGKTSNSKRKKGKRR